MLVDIRPLEQGLEEIAGLLKEVLMELRKSNAKAAMLNRCVRSANSSKK